MLQKEVLGREVMIDGLGNACSLNGFVVYSIMIRYFYSVPDTKRDVQCGFLRLSLLYIDVKHYTRNFRNVFGWGAYKRAMLD